MHLTATRPDIMYVVSLINKYMESPTEVHLLVTKRILHYLQGTKDFALLCKKGEKFGLLSFADSDYAGDQDDKKSSPGYVFMLGTGLFRGLPGSKKLSLYRVLKQNLLMLKLVLVKLIG